MSTADAGQLITVLLKTPVRVRSPATTRKEGSAPARCSGTRGCGAARLMSSCSVSPPRSTCTVMQP